jgi:hypothetical protein
MDSNWIHGPSGQNSGTTPKIVLEIGTILMIADDSDFSCPWDQFHWKGYLLSFPCICRTSKMEVVCNLDVCDLLMHISLALQHLLDALFVLYGPLLDS